MTRRQFHVALAVLAVSGLPGGLLSNRLIPGGVAWAQAVGGRATAARRSCGS